MTFDKLKMHSPDLTQDNIAKLQELFPSCVTEAADPDTGKIRRRVDFDQLRQELSDHIVEGPTERFELSWPGKRAATLAAYAPIAKTLRPCREESVDFDTTQNLFIEGDNLDTLKLLQETYLGKVKMIYIDPPYNTGNDFIYKDDFKQSTNDYLRDSEQIDEDGSRLVANPESNGRYHSDWLSMMAPRLRLARNLLRDDGVIFISIDDGEVAHLRKIADEIFGSRNFVTQFVWKKGGTGKNDSQFAIIEHEYILAYARQAAVGNFGVDVHAQVSTSYNYVDDLGRYSLVRLDSKTLGYIESLDFQIQDLNGKTYIPEQPEGKTKIARWRWSAQRVQENHAQLVFKNGFVYTKNYEKEGARPRSLLAEKRFGVTRTGRADAEKSMNQAGIFDYPKPVGLLSHLIGISSTHDDIILDFFAGSSTTAHAVMKLNAEDGGNRKFIMVQLPEEIDPKSEAGKAGYATIADLSKERIRRAAREIKGGGGELHPDWRQDVGFRVLKVDSSNMKDVYYRPSETAQQDLTDLADNVKEDRDDEDLLFQVLLDWGLDLTYPIHRETVLEQAVFTVGETHLIACFALSITEDLVKELAKREPLRIVFRDAGFASDAVKINAQQILRQLSPSTELKVI